MMHGQEMSLGQFVKQLTALLQKERVKLPFRNQRPWHVLFYELKKSSAPGRPKFFDQLRFDWDAPYPKCQQLSDFLNALHVTTSVTVSNPSFSEILVSDEVADRWANNLTKDDPDLRQFVNDTVARAKEEFAPASVGH